MSAINKIQLPNGTSYDLHDARITGVTSIPADQDTDVITSDGSYNNLVSCDIIPDEDVPETVESKAMDVKMEYLNEMLAKAPEITMRWDGTVEESDKMFYIKHPLIDINYPGVECVLVCYRKKVSKRRTDGECDWESTFGTWGKKKKGFCVVRSDAWDIDHPYYDFLTDPDFHTFGNFLLDLPNLPAPAGIVVRIPNPEYTGPSTKIKNALYKGVREYLWSDIKRIKLSKNNNILAGVGLTI